ncbi:lipopolysaccharide biosynthesis protein [Mangrovibacterium diazotrophicum]|uniref:O-antigen/teichoic acid export membrane protein n=1 Tax=Mangrovibacterium diazotrophicum TaxID=1261403 RepID=A0A419W9X5_9BACT|nr:polysaccharide biosynthesis C-terminal domain-containing protein [Mangrovibacterium diazotrophicum]RKD92280.1 O-antigen/teichoic acid export membrane protein [Mangrovibacterium diazotrophicum]
MSSFKKLVGDTAIYGVSSIVGRFLNWWLVPYYSHIFLAAEYGIVANLYSYMAFLLVLLTYGMETGYFRFASQAEDKKLVYSSSLISLFATSLAFVLVVFAFSGDIARWLEYGSHPEYIRWIALIMAFDAFTSIPFAKLRIESRPIKFAFLKLVNIFANIFFNIFFLSICPAILKSNPESAIRLIYNEEIGVGYVFISNLIASGVTLLMLLPDLRIKLRFSGRLLKEIVWYSFPILVVGVSGMVNQNIDKILIPKLIPDDQGPWEQVGIYSANYKLAVLMNMFIQAFRYAFEPFFFSQVKSDNNKRGYALILKYFVIFGLLIFLGISLFLDLFKTLHILDESYFSGLKVVPIVLMANLFLGIYYTLSLWYKLTDKTRFGAYFALIGAAISLTINIIFIPVFGYMASAWAVLICFVIMSVMSYFIGQKYFRVDYPIQRIGLYFLLALGLYALSVIIPISNSVLSYLLNAVLFGIFVSVTFMLENKEFRKFLR